MALDNKGLRVGRLSFSATQLPLGDYEEAMEILQAKVRLLQNFPQKVVLDTKKTKLSLIQLTIY